MHVDIHTEYRLVFANGTVLGPRVDAISLMRAWSQARHPEDARIERRVVTTHHTPSFPYLFAAGYVGGWTLHWQAGNYLHDLAALLDRLQRFASVALEQAQNQADYGTPDPSGGHGRQQYSITHPLFPDVGVSHAAT